MKIGTRMLASLVEQKYLVPVNPKPENGHRYHMRFDSKDVTTLLHQIKSGDIKVKGMNLSRSKMRAAAVSVPTQVHSSEPQGIRTSLSGIEKKIAELAIKVDSLIKIWA